MYCTDIRALVYSMSHIENPIKPYICKTCQNADSAHECISHSSSCHVLTSTRASCLARCSSAVSVNKSDSSPHGTVTESLPLPPGEYKHHHASNHMARVRQGSQHELSSCRDMSGTRRAPPAEQREHTGPRTDRIHEREESVYKYMEYDVFD
ncbi:hypothetical protein CesoFtcFv8_019293 [Champsocephalus esox]|uniref:Uncharacterized protein n=1 Tax=Champsocephalus esox TaxID=159716 RepID=A0AAN8BIV8_9TELE|nr:hypothetical protein CesoFtcFv8_019293 [Champsocephalus esox]